MGWSVWLLLSWAVNLAIDPPLMSGVIFGDHVAEFGQRVTPAVRGMLMSMIVGMGLIWPVVRLSQSSIGGLGVLYDWMGLMLVSQIVIWPMRIMLGWSLGRTLVIDLQLAVWTAAAGVMIWLGTRPGANGLTRGIAMLWCTLLLLGGLPMAAWTGSLDYAYWSPLYTVWSLVSDAEPGDIAGATVRAAAVLLGSAAAGVMGLRRPVSTGSARFTD